jgi:hypothetical protein
MNKPTLPESPLPALLDAVRLLQEAINASVVQLEGSERTQS